MTTILILAALFPGQIRQCQTAASYQRTYAAPARAVYAAPVAKQVYAAPAYQKQAYAAQTYASSYAAYAQPYLEVKFAPVIYEQYAGLVGGEARARNKREQELESRADLATRVDKLSAAITGL